MNGGGQSPSNFAEDFVFRRGHLRGGRRKGAGRPRLHGRTSEALALDIRLLAREGALTPGATFECTWARPTGARAAIRGQADIAALQLVYRFQRDTGPWQDVACAVPLDWTPCNFGGTRAWFRCPSCDSRRAILYLAGLPKCRGCYSLVYDCQSEGPFDRSLRRSCGVGAIVEGGRPKRMHLRTYDRYCDKFYSEKELQEELLDSACSKVIY